MSASPDSAGAIDPQGPMGAGVLPDPIKEAPRSDESPEPLWLIGMRIGLAIVRFVFTPQGAALTLSGIALLFAYQHLLFSLPEWWFNSDAYYTHGPLIPFLAAYIIWDRRVAISKAAGIVSGLDKTIAWTAGILTIPILFLAFIASRTDMLTVLSFGIVVATFLSTIFIWGYRKAWYAAPGILYLFLGFPIGRGFLDKLTNPLQVMSTSSAFHILKLVGLQPMQINANQLVIGDYSLYVAAACAGLGMSLSVFAFVVLFMLIGRLKWWGNVVMLMVWMPLVILINGIRIAMIGAVGNYYGDHAAASFHDYSGYLSLLLMFYILMKLTRALGWE